MTPIRRWLPPFHLGWFLAAVNLALWVYCFSGKEPWSPAAVSAMYVHPPGWDAPVFIAARPLQVPPLETPLLGVLMRINIPAFILSVPFALLFHRLFPVSFQFSLSYLYAAVLACLAIVQWLLIGRLLVWSVRNLRTKLTRAT